MANRAGGTGLVAAALALLSTGAAGAADPAGLDELYATRARFPLEHTAVGAVAGAGDGGVVVREADGGLHGIDPASGLVRWTRQGPGGSAGALWRDGEATCVAGAEAVERLATASGQLQWRWAPGGSVAVLAADSVGMLAAYGAHVALVSSREGAVAWRLTDGAGWEAGGLGPGHAVLASRGGALVFVSRARGSEVGRWKGAALAWRVTETGASVLVEVTRPGVVAALVGLDATGRELGRVELPRPEGLAGAPVIRHAAVTPDGAVVRVEQASSGRAWLVRRFAGQVEVVEADRLGPPVALAHTGGLAHHGLARSGATHPGTPADGAVLVFPGLGGAPWRILSAGRPAWSLALDGVDAGVGGLTGQLGPPGSGRWALLVAGDALVRLDLGLERVVGLGVAEGAVEALAAAWIPGPGDGAAGYAAGGWPLVVRGRDVVAGRATRLADHLARLREAEAAGASEEARERRGRLMRFGLTRGLLGADAGGAGGSEVALDATGSVEAEVASAPACEGPRCADPLALSDAEARTVATLREAWLQGHTDAAVAAAGTWLTRDPIPPASPQRVAAALGWLLLDVAVAVDSAPPEGLAGLSRAVAGLRAGLPWLERVLWALIAARGGDDDAAATFLSAREATALGLAARRAEAARALRRLREAAGKGPDAGARLATSLSGFAHLDALFGPTAARVRALLPRLASEATARDELDDYAHGLGLHLVGRAPMEVELCALGCELLAERCGADHLEDACVTRCSTSGAVRLAAASRAADTGPGWYCGP